MASQLVLDVPSTYDDLFFHSLKTADQIVIVANQTVAAIRGAQMLCESLGQRRPLIVINHYNPRTSGLTVERIQELLPECEICTLANDQAVVESMNGGMPLRLHARRSPVLSDLDVLLQKLEINNWKADCGAKHASLLHRLARVLSLT